MSWRRGVVQREVRRWAGAIEYEVLLQQAPDEREPSIVRALAYVEMVGEPRPGDEVLLNVSAVLKGLGTGGLAMIVAVPDRLPGDVEAPGHIVKARYTPQQQMFLAVDEQDSPAHSLLAAAAEDPLTGFPVVVADLHSALPAILAGLRHDRPQARVAYVMTDGGALPMAFSRTVAGLVEAGWLHTTLTVGQAFGGHHEAITVHSALVAARAWLGADAAIVCQGPGNVGTGSRWGFTGVACGEALNAIHTVGAHGVGALRVSCADSRPRHRGISHHSLTAYGRVALAPADIPVARPGNPDQQLVWEQAQALVDANPLLRLHSLDSTGLLEALDRVPVGLSTMGRSLADDPEAFLASAVAGRYAATLVP